MNKPRLDTQTVPVTLMLLLALLATACQRPKPPDFANIEQVRRLVINQAISPIRFTNSGDDGVNSCTASPALPGGLSVRPSSDGQTCEVAGTPTVSASRTTYTITGRNRRGPDTATIELIVEAMLLPPALTNASSEQSYNTSSAITPLLFANNNGQSIVECLVNPPLPAGLKLLPDAANLSCEISGTPSGTAPRRTYTVTAVNASGRSDATVIITVSTGSSSSAGAPALTAPTIPEFTAGTMIATISFANSGGSPQASNGCQSSPALPNGLSISRTSNGRSCQISGTPTAMTAARMYNITARNSTGSSTIGVSITVGASTAASSDAPALVTPTSIPAFTRGTTITPIVFTNNGGSPQASNGCQSEPALPGGLNISRTTNGRSCQITGAPTVAMATREYDITARNSNGSSTVKISVTVN